MEWLGLLWIMNGALDVMLVAIDQPMTKAGMVCNAIMLFFGGFYFLGKKR